VDATFTVTAGLSDGNGYSLRAADGRYLRHYNFRLRLDANDGSTTFSKDATFIARPGSAGGSVSLESYNFPGRYIRHRNFELWVDPYQDSDIFRADSSVTAVSPWA
jgi:Alpha-L-arabinofuranosidase B (ABFB) domain